jgi:hypothetical protein
MSEVTAESNRSVVQIVEKVSIQPQDLGNISRDMTRVNWPLCQEPLVYRPKWMTTVLVMLSWLILCQEVI